MLNHIKEYFGFTKKELNGLLVLCGIIILIAFAPYIYNWLNPPKVYDYSSFRKEMDEFRASATAISSKKYYIKESDRRVSNPRYFSFDPNTISEAQWLQLGLGTRQVHIIKNFLSKGGHFYKKEDLKKIYSITPQDYDKLEPFIAIPAKAGRNVESYKFAKGERPAAVPQMVDINTADSSSLELLKGIGPTFASRIIKYRNRLGGFHKKEQLLEVYGLDSVKYAQLEKQLRINSSLIKKVNVNTASFEELKRHPYLNYKQMNAILKYRKQHGTYSSMDDLKKVNILNEEILRKMEPYLEF